jgi:hypothetical protein
MKKITLFFALFVSLNTFSQTKKSFREVLYDSITITALPDLQKYTDSIMQYLGRDSDSPLNIIYARETIAISFNSEEYSEMMTNYTKQDDGLKENVLKVKTFLKLKQIDRAIDNDKKILYDLFDCFIYRLSIRYEDLFGWDAEYKIKIDNGGIRIIGKKISVILVDDINE